MASNNNYAYRNNWNKENLDRVNLTMEKGRKEMIKHFAQIRGESLNRYINRAIDAQMARDEEEV